MTIKKIFIVIPFLMLVLTIFYGLLTGSAQKGNPPTPLAPDDVSLASIGISYEQPVTPPSISQIEAIKVAKRKLGYVAKQADEILANYVLFSDDQYYSEDETGQKIYRFQNVPAWVITFRGVSYNIARGRGGNPTNTEVHVVIDATTGEYMELFTYR
ncbi:MAG: hypothetical protein AB1846_13275 [Chloroflexota bacterium]